MDNLIDFKVYNAVYWELNMASYPSFQSIPGPILYILAEDFVHSNTVYNKDYHDTPLYWFKVFSVRMIENLGQDAVQQLKPRGKTPTCIVVTFGLVEPSHYLNQYGPAVNVNH